MGFKILLIRDILLLGFSIIQSNFQGKHDPKSPDFEGFFFKSPDFYDKFQLVTKKY